MIPTGTAFCIHGRDGGSYPHVNAVRTRDGARECRCAPHLGWPSCQNRGGNFWQETVIWHLDHDFQFFCPLSSFPFETGITPTVISRSFPDCFPIMGHGSWNTATVMGGWWPSGVSVKGLLVQQGLFQNSPTRCPGGWPPDPRC